MTNRKFGWHSGSLTARDITCNNDLTISGDLTFGDATTDSLTVTGTATFQSDSTVSTSKKIQFRDTGLYINSSADGQLDIVADTTVAISGAVTMDNTLTLSGVDALNTITWNGTNTAITPALKFPDDTYIADADGALGAAAGFIIVDIGGTNYKLQTYAMT